MPDPAPSPQAGSPTIPAVLPDQECTCAGCGYDLRGLSTSARCPECGLLILKSLAAGDALTLADWKRLRTGTLLIVVANGMIVGSVVVGFVLPRSTTPWLRITEVMVGAAIVCAIGAGLAARGYRLLAAADQRSSTDYSTWRPGPALSVTAPIRACLAWIALASLLPLELASSRSNYHGLLTGTLALCLCLYLGAGRVQFAASMAALESIGLRSRKRMLGRLPAWYGAACFAAIFPGILAFGLGIPLAWILYLAVIGSFWWAADRQVRNSER